MESDSEEIEYEEVDFVFDIQSLESTIESPTEEWSSFIEIPVVVNKKREAYEQDLYSPGSGEVCVKYIPMSSHSIGHPLDQFPALVDPGIVRALQEPEDKIVYTDDGEDLYLALCDEMNLCPVRLFHRNLTNNKVDLSYYCVDPRNIRAMAKALRYNRTVESFCLKDNFLTVDAAYHLGEMLSTNSTLVELNLEGCRIGPEGARRLFSGIIGNRNLSVLDLSRNDLDEAGGEHFAEALFRGAGIKEINLRKNNLGSKTAAALAVAFETHNKLIHIDLSWNNFFNPVSACLLLNKLQENEYLEYLNLSWNGIYGLRIAESLKDIMLCPNLSHLDLSNNKFQGEDIDVLIENMNKAKQLVTFDLSSNPLTPDDALKVIKKMKLTAVKCKHLNLDNVHVNVDFLLLLERIMKIKSKKDVTITYGDVIREFVTKGTDPRELVLNRAEFLAKKPKRHPVDVALIFLQLAKDGKETLSTKELATVIKKTGATLDNHLIEAFANSFPGPKSKKQKFVNISKVVEYIRRKWPERKLTPVADSPQGILLYDMTGLKYFFIQCI